MLVSGDEACLSELLQNRSSQLRSQGNKKGADPGSPSSQNWTATNPEALGLVASAVHFLFNRSAASPLVYSGNEYRARDNTSDESFENESQCRGNEPMGLGLGKTLILPGRRAKACPYFVSSKAKLGRAISQIRSSSERHASSPDICTLVRPKGVSRDRNHDPLCRCSDSAVCFP